MTEHLPRPCPDAPGPDAVPPPAERVHAHDHNRDKDPALVRREPV
ncbi:MAG: tRNA (guanine-N7)-methyltransferase, partial [Micrococcus luteus]